MFLLKTTPLIREATKLQYLTTQRGSIPGRLALNSIKLLRDRYGINPANQIMGFARLSDIAICGITIRVPR